MSFETASVTSCGQSLLARATATNKLVFVNARIETTTRTASAIGSATSLPTLTNPVTGSINSVTYSLNQTRVTVRFNNLATTYNFHTVWLMARLADEADSAAVPICAIVSSEPIYIPTTSQSDTHIDIHMNLSFVNADGTVNITEGPAWMISDQIQYRAEVREELDDIESDIDDLQDTVVTKADTQTITGAKTFNATTTFGGAVQANNTLKVTGTATLGTVSAGSTTTGSLTTYAITPRTASTSDSTGYDLGAANKKWKTVYGRHGNFESSVSTDILNVSSDSYLHYTEILSSLLVEGTISIQDDLYAYEIYSNSHFPNTHSTSTSSGFDLGADNTRWRYVYGRYGNFSGSISTAGSLSVTGASTLTGNTTIGGTLGVTGSTTLAGVTTGAVSSYAISPRTASTSSSTGYDLGAESNRWKYVYARYGNFSYSLTVNGTVTATTFSGNLTGKLTTARNIDGMAFDGSASITHFGTCNTDAATAAKTVSLNGFSLTPGARILVKFTNSNTVSNPTLNVNGTGAVRIYLRVNVSAATTAVTSWEAGDTVEFVYDGSYWRKVNHTTNISGNAATATSATSATYASKLATSSTDYLYYQSSTYGLFSTQRICPSSNKGASLGHSSYYWNYGYIDTINSTTINSTTMSVTGSSSMNSITTSGNITVGGRLYFGTAYINAYNNGIDCYTNLTPGSQNRYELGSSGFMWDRLYVNYISGAGVAHSIAGYGVGTSQDPLHPIGSLILAQITTATNPSGTQLPSSTSASPSYFGDVPASKIRKVSLFASGNNGNTTCHQHTQATLSGTWRIIGDVWSSNVSSYPPVVLAVRIA